MLCYVRACKYLADKTDIGPRLPSDISVQRLRVRRPESSDFRVLSGFHKVVSSIPAVAFLLLVSGVGFEPRRNSALSVHCWSSWAYNAVRVPLQQPSWACHAVRVPELLTSWGVLRVNNSRGT